MNTTTMALDFFGLNVVTVTETIVQTVFIPVYPDGTFLNQTSNLYGIPIETITTRNFTNTESANTNEFFDEKNLWKGPVVDDYSTSEGTEPSLTEIYDLITTSTSTGSFEYPKTTDESTIPITTTELSPPTTNSNIPSSTITSSPINSYLTREDINEKSTSTDPVVLELSTSLISRQTGKKSKQLQEPDHLVAPVLSSITPTSSKVRLSSSRSSSKLKTSLTKSHETTFKNITKRLPHLTRKYTPPIRGNVSLPNESNNQRLRAEKITFLLIFSCLAILFT